jgi:hypothetical protein
VDTNVLITANGRDTPQASLVCIQNCRRKLRAIENHESILVLDNGFHIIKEYRHKVSDKGQPGLGDKFLKWVLTNLMNPRCCQQVPITPLPENTFKEFPGDPALAKFDPSDRKFVAVCLAHRDRPPICNAVDSDWQHFQQALERFGVRIEFLCP